MKFWQAMKELDEGKKIRCVNWPINSYMENREGDTWYFGFSGDLRRFVVKDWELYKEPEKTYSFMDIIPLLKEGKTFTRSIWSNPMYSIHLYKNPKGVCSPLFIDKQNYPAHITLEDVEAKDWIEVK